MTCYSKKNTEGETTFFCGDFGNHCNDSKCNWFSSYLCDYPVGNDKTCDRSLCGDHAFLVAPDMHYCAAHYNQWIDFKNKGGVKKELENVVPFKKV